MSINKSPNTTEGEFSRQRREDGKRCIHWNAVWPAELPPLLGVLTGFVQVTT